MKKICLVILCAVWLFGATAAVSLAAPAYVPGDVDADGDITPSDARLALRCSVSLEKYKKDSAAFLACDVDGDGEVKASDARMILRASVSLDILTTEEHTHLFRKKIVRPTCTDEGYTEKYCPVCGLTDITDRTPATGHQLEKIARVEPTADRDGNVAHYHCRVCGNDYADAQGTERLLSVTLPKTGSSQLSSAELFKMAKKFTVEITAYGSDFVSTGTGFFLSKDGKIATNYHVIEGASRIEVLDCNNQTHPVKQVLAADPDMDLAVLKIDGTYTAAALNRKDYDTGDKVYALGSSNGLTYTFSDGIISSRARVVEDYHPDMTYIQTTAPISHGNSGGPLIDETGKVVGINTWMDTGGQNLNFAIPVFYLDELDYSNPMTPEEAGGLNRVDAQILVNTTSLTLRTGACAFFPLRVTSSSDDFTISFNCDSDAICCEWSEWEGDDIVLIIYADAPTGAVPIRIFIKENPDVSVTVNVKVSDTSGYATYYSENLVPDFGVMTGVSPYDVSYHFEGGENTFLSYDANTLYDNGFTTTGSCRAPYFRLLEQAGFRLQTTKETYDTTLWIYINDAKRVVVGYEEVYDEDGYCASVIIALAY